MAKAANPHEAAIERHHNSLYDAVALLDSLVERLDDLTPSPKLEPERAEQMHNMQRLATMAHHIIRATAEDFSNVPSGDGS